MKFFVPFLFTVSILCSTHTLANEHSIPRITEQATIDGDVSDSVWKKAKKISLTTVTAPFENTASPVSTEAYVYEDGEHLFLAFIAEDKKQQGMRGAFRDRDQVWGDDLVGIKLDTFNDASLAYQFFANPFGSQMDAIENELTGSESMAWDAIWYSEGQLTEQGYQVEMKIPLNNLNFKEQSREQTWGFELVRFYPREHFYRISNMTVDRNNDCTLCQMGKINGFANVKQGNNLQIVPSVVGGVSESREYDSEWDKSTNSNLGVSVNWGISSDIDLSATLNPDFSQVEADNAQLNINNTFDLFIEEKRPFFLKNEDYFATNNYNLVYTRNIAEPDWGVKLTGRQGAHTFAVFSANDSEARFLIPGNISGKTARLKEKSTNSVLRYRNEVSEQISLGWITTHREAGDYFNTVHSVDGLWRPTAQDKLEVQINFSNTAYPLGFHNQFCSNDDCDPSDSDSWNESALRTLRGEEDFSGRAYAIEYVHDERDWYYKANYRHNDKDFNAHMGFVPRADFKRMVTGGGYRWYNENSWWHTFKAWGDWDKTTNDAGELQEKELEGYIQLLAIRDSALLLGYGQRDRVGPRHDPMSLAITGNTALYNENYWIVAAEADLSANSFASIRFTGGNNIDFTNDQLGDRLEINPYLEWDLNHHLSLSIDHTFQKFTVDSGHLFTANLTDFRLSYQFDSRSFIRLSSVYQNIERSEENYQDKVDGKTVNFSNQLLYGYKINPLSLLFVGYGDQYEKENEQTLRQLERTVFIKLSYAWQA